MCTYKIIMNFEIFGINREKILYQLYISILYINIYQCMGSFQNALFGGLLDVKYWFGCHLQYSVEVGGEIYKKCYLSRI